MDVNRITENIIGASIDVHKELGPGLLESVYEECLCYELKLRNVLFLRQYELPIKYIKSRYKLWLQIRFVG